DASHPIAERALQNKWLGKKTGRGFYVYDATRKSKTPQVNEHLLPASTTSVRPEEIHWRLVLPMINETARLLEEDVTDSTDAIDLATVLGIGFAPFRGGIVNFANSIGAEEIVRRLDELAARHGERFAPADLLREVAATHRPIAHMATFASQNENSQHPVH